MGPGRPVYHLLESLCFQDVYRKIDDFDEALNTNYWTTVAIGGGTVYARLANQANGAISCNGTTTSGDGARITAPNHENFIVNHRPLLVVRHKVSAITTVKVEVGFAAAAADGQVNAKATPTSTGSDYAVLIFDTADDTTLELITDASGTPTTASTSITAPFTADTYATWMLAGNENNEWAAWHNGALVAKSADGVAHGPADNVTLAPHLVCQTRTNGNSRTHTVDYAFGYQERVSLV